MAGRQDFTTPPTNPASGGTVAVQERPEVKEVNGDQTANLAAGSTQTTEVYAPAGGIYRVKGLNLRADGPGGTTGTHQFRIEQESVKHLTGSSLYSSLLQFQRSYFRAADNNVDPPTDRHVYDALTSATATENKPVRIPYYNNSDATQTATRTIRLIVEEVGY